MEDEIGITPWCLLGAWRGVAEGIRRAEMGDKDMIGGSDNI